LPVWRKENKFPSNAEIHYHAGSLFARAAEYPVDILFIEFAYGNFRFPDANEIPFYGGDFLYRREEGFVGAHKSPGRKLFFYRFHGHACKHRPGR